jgi:hypothetical protein
MALRLSIPVCLLKYFQNHASMHLSDDDESLKKKIGGPQSCKVISNCDIGIAIIILTEIEY